MKTLSVPLELERQFGYSPEPQKWWPPPNAIPVSEIAAREEVDHHSHHRISPLEIL